MGRDAYQRNIREIERLRHHLYRRVRGRQEVLSSQEICEVSKRLDKLILQYMSSQIRNTP